MASEEGFGMRLQSLRHKAGLSQSGLAKAAGVSLGSLRNWEHGRREPLLSAVISLSKALGVSLDVLAGLVEPPAAEAAPPTAPSRPAKDTPPPTARKKKP